jgi:uncharacterized protein YicC (UPF0701 family)
MNTYELYKKVEKHGIDSVEIYIRDVCRLDENEWNLIDESINVAITEIVQYRIDEAASLEIDFKERIKNINMYLEEVKALDGDRVENVKTRLKKISTKKS